MSVDDVSTSGELSDADVVRLVSVMAQPLMSGFIWGVADNSALPREWSGRRDESRLRILLSAILSLLDMREPSPDQLFMLSIAWQELKGMVFPVTTGGLRVVYACVRKPELLKLITRALIEGGREVASRTEPPMVTAKAREIGEYPNELLVKTLHQTVETTISRQAASSAPAPAPAPDPAPKGDQ